MSDFAKLTPYFGGQSWLARYWPVVVGVALLSFPTLQFIATESWTTEQGSHGPLVLASGLWLLFRLMPDAKAVRVRPPLFRGVLPVLLATMLVLAFRRAAIVELEVYALYLVYIALLYAFLGWRAVVRLWFPLIYLAFAVPMPDSLIALATNPLKLWISQSAVTLLYQAGYPIANSGVMIYIGQYQLLVAAACAGLNSLITLSALTLFYVYLTHKSNWKYMIVLIAAVIPIAIFANLMRVLILILLTFYAGEAVAQGFLHNFAGMTTFAIALVSIYLFDLLCQKITRRGGSGRAV